MGNFNELVKYLTRDNERWDDMCKLRAVFLWVTSIDVYNLKVDGVPPTHSPLEYFTKIQCNMGNHAHLISGLCQLVNYISELDSVMLSQLVAAVCITWYFPLAVYPAFIHFISYNI